MNIGIKIKEINLLTAIPSLEKFGSCKANTVLWNSIKQRTVTSQNTFFLINKESDELGNPK